MARASYVFDPASGEVIERGAFLARQPLPKRSHLPTPMIATDTMEATQHPCDGRFYTSKSRFRAETRAHGCIEVGNDPARLRPKSKTKPDTTSNRAALERALARSA